jgi:hypothetical protein
LSRQIRCGFNGSLHPLNGLEAILSFKPKNLDHITKTLAHLQNGLAFWSVRIETRNAAKLAVYEEMMMRVKNHQKLAIVRPDMALQERYKNGQFF